MIRAAVCGIAVYATLCGLVWLALHAADTDWAIVYGAGVVIAAGFVLRRSGLK